MNNNSHWSNSFLLEQDRKKAFELILKQGMQICYDSEERNYAKSIFFEIGNILKSELMNSTLSLIYLYDQTKQPVDIASNDGYSSISECMMDGRQVSAIGISLQALHYSKKYAIMVFLHELTHILYRTDVEHGKSFHKYLDDLIDKYNKATGENIQNDYYGLH